MTLFIKKILKRRTLQEQEMENSLGLSGDSDGEEPTCQFRRHKRNGFAGEGNSYLLQYFCLENPMDRRAWWATVGGVAKSCTRLED